MIDDDSVPASALCRPTAWRRAARATALCLVVALAGCAGVDRFGSRAVTYNQQLQESRKTAIILNILRASDDEPLQFSEVTTVTGQGSVQANAAGELPLIGSAAGGPRLFNFLPGGQASGGPAFTVANLNTQEFFNGITAPIKPEIIASYASIGYSRYTLLPLLVSTIEFDRAGKHYVFLNDPTNSQAYSVFIHLLDAMIQAGLSFETVEKLDPVGPALSGRDLRAAEVIKAMLATPNDAALRLKSFSVDEPGSDLNENERKALRALQQRTYYRLTRTELVSRYCFASDQISLREAEAGVTSDEGAAIVLQPITVQGREFVIRLGSAMKCGARAAARTAATEADPLVVENLRFSSRSVRSVFEYLGQITRIERAAGSPVGFDVNLPNRGTYRVFGIGDARGDGSAIDYDGSRFMLTRASASDESNRTIQLLSELLALYSSAKSFPTPSVVPILYH